LGDEAVRLSRIWAENKKQLEDLKATQKLYDESGKQGIQQWEEFNKTNLKLSTSFDDIGEKLDLQLGARGLKRILGPLDDLEQKLIDDAGAMEDLGTATDATRSRFYAL